jgi:hypothetical protein
VLATVSGEELGVLGQGHYDTVTACVYSPLTGHLWSTGLDGAVLAWCPYTLRDPQPQPTSHHYMDAWLAAAAAGRGRQQGMAGSSGNNSVAAVAAGGRAVGSSGDHRVGLPDLDCWSEEEEFLQQAGAWVG